ncbi:thin [Carabus blaptoides fortunei]
MPSETNLKMKRRGSLNPLEELVQCALCMDKLTVPKMLPCQHTFCLNCLQPLVGADVKEIECPTCKKSTPLEKGPESLEELPGNLYIDSVLKLLTGNSSPVTPTQIGPETRCIKCQTMCQFSEHACQHCKQIFCGVCWHEHVNELREKLTSLQEQLKESHVRLDHRLDAFNDRCLQLEENIKAATEIKIKEIKKREEGCLSEANKIKQDGIKSSAQLRDRLKQMEKNTEVQEFDKITDENQKINHFITLHRNTAALLDELSRWGDTRTIFDASSFKIDYETDASLDAEADDDSILGVSGVGNPLENPDSMAMYYRSRSFTPRLTWTKCPRPAGVSVAPWNPNCLYVAGTDSRQIYGVDKLKVRRCL